MTKKVPIGSKKKKTAKVKLAKFEIAIKVDTNDADYNTKVSVIDELELKDILPLVKAIKKSGDRHNYDISDNSNERPEDQYPQFPEELHEFFQDLCEYGEYGFHTIESVEVTPYVKKTKLL